MRKGGLFFLFLFSVNALFAQNDGVKLIVLGTVQDAGSPHIACKKECCAEHIQNNTKAGLVSCLGLVDLENGEDYIFDASPDFTMQLENLKAKSNSTSKNPSGIFLTHAHIGHYTGLMYLGREALGAKNAKVYAMPKMKSYLENNGPWEQLVKLNNISLQSLSNKTLLKLNERLNVTPIRVPHRDEYSETVGFHIQGPNKSALFIPDIDKWSKWDEDIVEWVSKVDYAFLDGSFYSAEELPHRDISEIPHPLITESMELFRSSDSELKSKVYFIHMNHSNRMLNPESAESKKVLDLGFNIAREGMEFGL